jgi:hypothetical protein
MARLNERDLADLIEDLEHAHDLALNLANTLALDLAHDREFSNSFFIRDVTKAAADYLWQLRCDLTSTSPTQGEQQ